MYTITEIEVLCERMKNQKASKADIVKAVSAYCLGFPYVFGAWGCLCIPENRRIYANRCKARKPAYAEKIVKACPVLSGKQSTCDGCKWEGCLCFDCRGFTHWLLEQVGLQLYGDTVTTQWDTKSNWAVQGDIADMPGNLVCCIFRKGHTGMYLGGGVTRHCSTIVKEEPMPGRPRWQRWGIPSGLYSLEKLREAGLTVEENRNIPTIRRGANGCLVVELQTRLNDEIGDGLTTDGIFGAKTEEAVKSFQRANNLKADGIVGPKTWAALGVTDWEEPEMSVPPGEEPETPGTEPGIVTVNVPLDALIGMMDNLKETSKHIQNLSEIIGGWIEEGGDRT